MVAGRRTLLTKIMNGLVRGLASNGLQVSNKDRWDLMEPFEQTQYHPITLRWRYNKRDSVSNHQPLHCLLYRLFRRSSKKTSKLRVSSIGRVFRSPLRWRWKMAALPLPVAILDDLISGSRKWGHPRWRPEAEGPPFSTSTSLGIEKRAPGPGWRHFRPRHLGSKMATAAMTSGGRRDAREDVLQTSAPSMSPVEIWLYWKHLIVSLTQALSKWLSELPTCYYAEVISLHMSKVVKNLRLQQAPTLLFFFNCTLQ